MHIFEINITILLARILKFEKHGVEFAGYMNKANMWDSVE